MQRENSQLIYSPSDLIQFLESPFASWMQRLHIECPGTYPPDERSDQQKLVANAGNKHESDFLQQLQSGGKDVCIIPRSAKSESETRQAIGTGREIIYQALLQKDQFRGYADFLIKTPGQNSYEVCDTKVARSVKPYYLIQLCCYSEMLVEITGTLPERVHVVLGNKKQESFRTENFSHYYLQVKKAFLDLMKSFDLAAQRPVPDPRADHGIWQSYADKYIQDSDHLVQVAGMTTGQIKKLNAANIHTVAQLAKSGGIKISGLPETISSRFAEQADLQVQTRDARKNSGNSSQPPVFKVLPPPVDEPSSGLAKLPPKSQLDVYFDMEGFPLVEDGLEYLFGAVCHDQEFADGKLLFKDWWAHNRAEEKKALENFVDWVYARWKKDPAMHIYHYADYERAALRRLASRHATREQEIDSLLRAGVFIDLYKIVRSGLRIGEPSYSIKSVELLYRPQKRSGDVKTAGDSLVIYDAWIKSGESRDCENSKLLKSIRDYNEDDCQSTHQLVEWLRALQAEHKIAYTPAPEKPAKEPNESAEARKQEHANLENALALKLQNCAADSEEFRITELFQQLLDFHWREKKPFWWALYDWRDNPEKEESNDFNSLSGLVLENDNAVKVKRSLVFTYRCTVGNETKIKTGDKVSILDESLPKGTVEEFDPDQNLLKLKISGVELKKLGGIMPRHTAIRLNDDVNQGLIENAIHAIALNWAAHGELPGALKRFLFREAPEISGTPAGNSLTLPNESSSQATERIVRSMRESVLCIQGPPGTGKTTTASHIIAALLKDNKKVGITSNSYKAIHNLLRASGNALNGEITGVAVKKNGTELDDALQKACPNLVWAGDGGDAAKNYSSGILAGTAWLFARDDMEQKLDYLFVDEAGQICMANLIAISRSAKNIVLMGDQMQLEQPVQGSHPGESGTSSLVYYLQEHATIPENLGVFLGTSHRMHPEICRFVSETCYEGRLHAAPGTEKRKIALPQSGAKWITKEAGLVFSPVPHDGNTQSSDEEVERILKILDELLGRTLFEKDGTSRPLQLDDILFVAPYNMQARKLEKALPPGARVGSVDRFQGQEAPVVILSMCSSFGEYGSRGLDFLLDKNRMNVAISRAQALAIVVGDPRIATTEASNIRQMERINLFCKLQ